MQLLCYRHAAVPGVQVTQLAAHPPVQIASFGHSHGSPTFGRVTSFTPSLPDVPGLSIPPAIIICARTLALIHLDLPDLGGVYLSWVESVLQKRQPG